MSGVKAMTGGEAHFFEENMNPERIRRLLNAHDKEVNDKREGMKYLLAMMSKGRNMSNFMADVVKNVIAKDVEVKKLVYMYLVHYADFSPEARELALLSINSFQKDLAATNQLIRALALRVMTGIRVKDIVQIQMIAVKKCAGDNSAYVRKAAAHACTKIWVQDRSEDQRAKITEVIGKLLNDTSTMVLSSAIGAFNEVCPNAHELLHKPYRKICHLLADLDEWGQVTAINVLMRYARTQFVNPVFESKAGGADAAAFSADAPVKKPRRRKRIKKAFYSDEEDEEFSEEEPPSPEPATGGKTNLLNVGANRMEELDPDHRLLLKCSLPLLKSRNTGVVLQIVTLHQTCGPASTATAQILAKALVRIQRGRKEIQYVVLKVIARMVDEDAEIFQPFIMDFMVKSTDPAYVRRLKLEIVAPLVTDETATAILREMQAYVRHEDRKFVCNVVQAIGSICARIPHCREQCVRGLMQLVQQGKREEVAAEAVVVIRQILQKGLESDPSGEYLESIVRSLAANLATTTNPTARASMVWVFGEYRAQIPELAPVEARPITRELQGDII